MRERRWPRHDSKYLDLTCPVCGRHGPMMKLLTYVINQDSDPFYPIQCTACDAYSIISYVNGRPLRIFTLAQAQADLAAEILKLIATYHQRP